MQPLNEQQIQAVIDWMDRWFDLDDEIIQSEFREDFSKHTKTYPSLSGFKNANDIKTFAKRTGGTIDEEELIFPIIKYRHFWIRIYSEDDIWTLTERLGDMANNSYKP